jgi:hypothetical protein
MKTLKSLFILSALTLGTNVYSKETPVLKITDIKVIKLNSGDLIRPRQIERIQFAHDRENKIDYIELFEGSLIDSYDINRAILKEESSKETIDSSLINSTFMLSRVLGDGSGG